MGNGGISTKKVWSEQMLLDAYDLARTGLNNSQIAIGLGVPTTTFDAWVTRKEILKNALFRARIEHDSKRKTGSGTRKFHDYLYDRLPTRLRLIWDEIWRCNSPDVNDTRRIEALMSKTGTRARQQLFIHAFTTCNFQYLAACRIIAIAPQTVTAWIENDPDFAGLYKEIIKLKDDFFEDAFLDLVGSGHPAAVMYGVKTKCASRGYGDKTTVEHSHTHDHTIVSVEDLHMSLDERKALLSKIQNARRKGLPDPNVIEGEFSRSDLEPSLDN